MLRVIILRIELTKGVGVVAEVMALCGRGDAVSFLLVLFGMFIFSKRNRRSAPQSQVTDFKHLGALAVY